MKKIAILWLCCLMAPAAVRSEDRIREFFEWGEYDSLLLAVDVFFAGQHDAVDSGAVCRYRGYQGVARFAKGDIAEAERLFRVALECRNDLTLDKQYVTPEMMNVFAAVKNAFENERLRLRGEDSLRRTREQERLEAESRKKATAARAAAISSNFWENTGLASFSFAAAGTLGTLCGVEYAAGRREYQTFSAAAGIGDKVRYDSLRSVILRRNRSIMWCSIGTGLCGSVGVFFAVKAARLSRMKVSYSVTGDRYVAAAAFDF